MEFTILIPCLNEEETISICIEKALQYCALHNLKGEIIIADNGSTDRTALILESYTEQYSQVKVVPAEVKGYGNAISAGIKAARGKYIIMADGDDSYNFLELDGFVEALRAGKQLVVGNRFSDSGMIEKGAMPFLHQYIGNPILSWIGRQLFGSKVKDFHCGMRGFEKEAIEKLELECGDMEFASEMIVKAELAGLVIHQIPVKLYPDGRRGKSHLRSFYHGFKHLYFLLSYWGKKGMGLHIKKYMLTYLIGGGSLICLLFITSLIPKQAIYSNLLKTAAYWTEEETLFYNLVPQAPFTKIDNHADSILLNIMYHVDETKPIESLFRASFYRADGRNALESFVMSLEDDKIANIPYERYWHGMMMILRPLFTLFSIVEIRMFFSIVLGGLLLWLLVCLYRKKMWLEIGAAAVGFLLVSGFMIPFCIEYVSTWLIALVISLLVLRWEEKKPWRLGQLFMISGICTAFFDFLTTETIALLLPLILLLGARAKRKEQDGALKIAVQYGSLWLGSYGGMWALKWALSGFILGSDKVSSVVPNIEMRLNGNIVGLRFAQYLEAPFRNLADLLIFVGTKKYIQIIIPLLIFLFAIFTIVYFFHKPWKQLKVSIVLFLLGLVPILRFMVLNNHSYIHHFFTYRVLFATIVAWSMALYYGCQLKRKKSVDV